MREDKNFWHRLKKPIYALAPMADVTDAAFRRVIARYGKPDVMWTEFVSADGLMRATSEGKRKLMKDLIYDESERPIVAQLFSASPLSMKQAAALCRELGFDGLDVNMGCPDKGIEKQGAGAAMIKTPKLARQVLRAAMEGAYPLPVSVKTRSGYNKDEIDTWLPELLAENPAVITIHARTRKEMSKVPARWQDVKRAVEIRNNLKSETLIFGNGDVTDLEDAKQKVAETGADGVMLGRAIFGNPWLFKGAAESSQCTFAGSRKLAQQSFLKSSDSSPWANVHCELSANTRLSVLIEHTKLFEQLLGDVKNFAIMKKHFKSYLSGIPNSGGLREQLMASNNAMEMEKHIQAFLIENTAL